jgi:hypothetical protein
MLNELLVVERGARLAGIEMPQRHKDINAARRIPTLVVALDEQGHIASIRPFRGESAPWTLRNAQQNSFPFVQPKPALLDLPPAEDRIKAATDRRSPTRRVALLDLTESAPFNESAFDKWPGGGFLGRLRERLTQFESLRGTDAEGLPAAIERFLMACARDSGPAALLRETVACLRQELERTNDTHWLDAAAALLVGKKNPKTHKFESIGAILFDAKGKWRSLSEPGLIGPVSDAVRASEQATAESKSGCCGLTGQFGPLVESTFPQPNLPVLGQTFIYARNPDTQAGYRYRRSSAETMPVGQEMADRLAAAVKALTGEERHGKTWRAIPGEAPKQSDLLLAFVEVAPDIPVAAMLADDDADDDYSSEECDEDRDRAEAAFEKRTERVIEAVRAKVDHDFRATPVRLAVLRKVDEANRQVVYAGEVPVGDYYDAAKRWAKGVHNLPGWLQLPVLKRGERRPRLSSPPHIAPLGLIKFSRVLFIRGGAEEKEVIGIPAAEVMGFFLEDDTRRTRRILRLVLSRRATLVSGAAHSLRRPSKSKSAKKAKKFDGPEVLRTASVLGLLLARLGRRIGDHTEDYMNDTGFKLGQLLAAADVVHAGYCADVRGGALPPSLLGNQVLTMAQAAPIKALEMLGRRWKPYDGWAKRASRETERIKKFLVMADRPNDPANQGYWDIKKALRHAREMGPLASEIQADLAEVRVDDVFRAELLLGYLAGLPKAQRAGDSGDDAQVSEATQ